MKEKPYLTPRKRRRIKRRGERGYLEAIGKIYGVVPLPEESSKDFRARCRATFHNPRYPGTVET